MGTGSYSCGRRIARSVPVCRTDVDAPVLAQAAEILQQTEVLNANSDK
jgi:hypothetical protein